jgi:glycosyltransferase involved in cell wall biosynthesis
VSQVRIAINALVTPAQKTGVGNYISSLVKALQEIDKSNTYFVYTGPDIKHLFDTDAPNFRLVELPFRHSPVWLMRPALFLWLNSLIGAHLRHNGIDVLHIPNIQPLVAKFVPTVLTVTDLTEYNVADKYSWPRQQYRKLVIQLAARRADRIITISESVKRELIARVPIPTSKVDVVHLAPAHSVREPTNISEAQDTLSAYGIDRDYILYVGKMLPHKNLRRVLQAYALLRSRHQVEHQLVLAGNRDDHAQELRILAEELGIAHSIVFTGYVPDEDLPVLYTQATLTVFPSISEGFGLPVVESMQFGTPVVTSNISSLAEVAGETAVLVDPYDVESIATGMHELLSSPKLRQELAEKGRRHAKSFSWKKCAALTLEAYLATAES